MEDIIYEKFDGIGLITLNTPKKRNAVNNSAIDDWVLAIKDAKEDDDVRALMVTGKGTSFCSGADFSFSDATQAEEMKGFPFPLSANMRFWEKHGHKLVREVWNFPKPYICALNGPATGAGMDFASMCDLRIASDTARVAMTYVNMGLAPGGAGCYYLPKIIGLSRALELIWTGRWVDAEEMLKIGYVIKIVPHESLLEESISFTKSIASGPPIAHRFSKKLAYSSYDLTMDEHLDMTAFMKLINWSTKDVGEGISAFLEKRKPHFIGE